MLGCIASTGEMKLEDLSSVYWMKHKHVLLIAGLCGVAFVVFSMQMHSHNRGYLLGLSILSALLCSPFTLKTASGRLWWSCFAIAFGSGIIAVLLGPQNLFSWILTVVAAVAYAVSACLRWNPPAVEPPTITLGDSI